MQAAGRVLGQLAKRNVEDNLPSPARLDVEDGAGRHMHVKDLFQTRGLGTKLNLVIIPAPPFAAFVFDGIGVGPKLDEVGDADDAQAIAPEPKAAHLAKRRLGMFLAIRLMHLAMSLAPLDGAVHVLPARGLFDAVQGASHARTEDNR